MTGSVPSETQLGSITEHTTENASVSEVVDGEGSDTTSSDETSGASYWFGEIHKDITEYKFWGTQPVESFDRKPGVPVKDGPIQSAGNVANSPSPLDIEGAQWVTLDLANDNDIRELYNFLDENYVEDDGGTMRFQYPIHVLKW
jgi:hypothetical protein